MPLTLAHIPDHDQAPDGAQPTAALTGLRTPGSRRTVLRAVTLGAMMLGAAALDWSGRFGSRAARAERGTYGSQGWDRNDCRDAYPEGYEAAPDTSGMHKNSYPACYGGSWQGSNYCDAGWHKYGTWHTGTVRADHVPISTACGTTATKNAWRWTTPDGVVYRCSDGYTTFWAGDQRGLTYLTICRSAV